ncbi:peptidylprolyl isomerase [Staphylospora marina]|uniref:peptidylprolyl isomerase n=1 Tax=Staphylospora marina TaxID=2490858 RepID=UPI000F5BC108|nr:peptidylprolyl isomerase [Staphylospora marina]
MQKRNNRWLKGLLAVLLSGALVLTGCGGQKEEDTSANPQEAVKEFKPLPTDSTKKVLEYKGGSVAEGELNRYLNLMAFLDQQIGFIIANMKEEESKQFREEMAKDLASRRYIATLIQNDAEYGKKADESMKQFESELLGAASEQDGKGPKTLDEAIKDKGFAKEDLHRFFVEYHKIEQFLNDRLKNVQVDQVKVQHVLVSVGDGSEGTVKRTDAEAKKRADEVKKKLEAGEDFAAIAKQYSDDPGSKDNSGMYEGDPDQFVPEFANACKTLPIGKISDPVKTQFGYHVMKVTERKKIPATQASEEAQMEKKKEIYQQFIDKELGARVIA